MFLEYGASYVPIRYTNCVFNSGGFKCVHVFYFSFEFPKFAIEIKPTKHRVLYIVSTKNMHIKNAKKNNK